LLEFVEFIGFSGLGDKFTPYFVAIRIDGYLVCFLFDGIGDVRAAFSGT
jgi:hypothetical protein